MEVRQIPRLQRVTFSGSDLRRANFTGCLPWVTVLGHDRSGPA
ncbi:pentapeptide repeat-containing protein [Nocardia sp. NPDC002869]